jgi:hypothetical protein
MGLDDSGAVVDHRAGSQKAIILEHKYTNPDPKI